MSTNGTNLLDTRAGLALANTAWREGAAAMHRAHMKVNEDRENGADWAVFHKPTSPYSAPLLRRIAEDKENNA